VRIFDAHAHADWGEAGLAGGFLKALDAAGCEGAAVISPLCERHEQGATPATQRASIDFIADFAAADPSRLIPFAHIAAQLPGAADAVRQARDRGCLGLKMIPNHWYPYDPETAFPVYRAAEEAGLPVIFHSGMLWAFGDGSRFARPVHFEALVHFPKLRFALAHIGWPWADECLALWERLEAQARQDLFSPRMYVDCTPGPPGYRRAEVVGHAVRCCSCDWLLFGTDAGLDWDGRRLVEALRRDHEMLAGDLALPPGEQEKFFGLNLLRFVGGHLAPEGNRPCARSNPLAGG
jgi:predicted TIM-barrel fold metal-dependent hydrolase